MQTSQFTLLCYTRTGSMALTVPYPMRIVQFKKVIAGMKSGNMRSTSFADQNRGGGFLPRIVLELLIVTGVVVACKQVASP